MVYRWHKHFVFYIITILLLQECRPVLLSNIDDYSREVPQQFSFVGNEDDIEHNKLLTSVLAKNNAAVAEWQASQDQSPRFIYNENGEKREIMSPDEYETHYQNKRVAWVAVGVGLLVGTSMLASIGLLSFDLYLSKKGCCGLDYDTCDHIDDYNKYAKLCAVLKNDTNDLFTESENLMENALELNTLASNILSRIVFFDQLTTVYLELIDSEISNKFNNMSQEISEKIDALDTVYETLEDISYEVGTLFSTDWGTAIGIISFALIFTFATYRVVKAYKSHQLAAAIADGSALPQTRPRSNAVSQTNLDTSRTAWVRSQLTWSNAMAFGMIVLDIANIVFSIITILQHFENCEKSEDTAKNASDTIKIQHKSQQEVYDETVLLYGNASESYTFIRDTLTEESFVEYCEQVSWLLGNASSRTEDEETALADINAYIASYDDDSLTVFTYYDLAQKLTNAFYEVNYNMFCLVRKSEEADAAVAQCMAGSDSLQDLYDAMKEATFQNSNCTQSGYITYDSFSEEVEEQVYETGYEKDCLLNSVSLRSSAASKWREGYTASEMYDQLKDLNYDLTDDQIDYLINVAAPGDVSSQLEDSIQTQNLLGKSLDEVQVQFFRYDASQVEDAYKSTVKKEVNETTTAEICLEFCAGKSEDEVYNGMTGYYEDQVRAAYQTCDKCDWNSDDKTLLCFMVNYNVADYRTKEEYLGFQAKYDNNDLYPSTAEMEVICAEEKAAGKKK